MPLANPSELAPSAPTSSSSSSSSSFSSSSMPEDTLAASLAQGPAQNNPQSHYAPIVSSSASSSSASSSSSLRPASHLTLNPALYPLSAENTPPNLASFSFTQGPITRRFIEMPGTKPSASSTSSSALDAGSSLHPEQTRKRTSSPSTVAAPTNSRKIRRIDEGDDAAIQTAVTVDTTTSPQQDIATSTTSALLNTAPVRRSTKTQPSSDTQVTGSAASSSLPSAAAPAAVLDSSPSPVPVSNPTGSLETPLSPANSPRTDYNEDQSSSADQNLQASKATDSNIPSASSSSSSPPSPSTALTKSTVSSFIIQNLTSPSKIPRSLTPLTTADDIHNVIGTFTGMPSELKRHVLFKLLRSCDRKTLSLMSGIIVHALRRDIVSALPAELIPNILGYLDYKSLCNSCKVSKSWRSIIDASEITWKRLLLKDEYTYTEAELKRAQSERWDYVSWGISPTASDYEKAQHFNATKSLPSLEQPINIFKAFYRKKHLINQNWMDPNSQPYHLSVPGKPRDIVTCLQFDDDKIIIGSDDHTITIYDTTTGALKVKLRGHGGGVWALQYIGNTLVSGSTDRTVRVWDIERQLCTHVFQGHISTVRCLDVMLPVQVGTDKRGSPIMAPKQALIVTGSRDRNLRVWKLPPEGSGPKEPSDIPENGNDYFLHTLHGHEDSVRAISGYGELVVSGSYDKTVRVWEVETGRCRWVLEGHAQRVYSAVIDPKRNRCISGSMDWLVKVWSLETGSLLYTLQGHTSLVGLVDLNRTSIVSAAADATLRVWNPDDGSFLHKLEGHKGAIISFQHDEYKVVSGSEQMLKLWNIRTGKLVRDLLQGMQRIWQVRFDGRRCVAVVMRDDKTSVEVLDFDYDPFSKTRKNHGPVEVISSDQDDDSDQGEDQDEDDHDGDRNGNNHPLADNNSMNFNTDAIAPLRTAAASAMTASSQSGHTSMDETFPTFAAAAAAAAAVSTSSLFPSGTASLLASTATSSSSSSSSSTSAASSSSVHTRQVDQYLTSSTSGAVTNAHDVDMADDQEEDEDDDEEDDVPVDFPAAVF